MNRFETKDPIATDSSESAVGGMSAPFNSALLDALKQRVVIGDGAMGTMLQTADLTLDDFLGLEYRGVRCSLGYGACPDLEDRAKLVVLLEPERIGVELSEELQLHPEQSTDFFVLHHPEAKYFNA